MSFRFLAIAGDGPARAALISSQRDRSPEGFIRRGSGARVELWAPDTVPVLAGEDQRSFLVGFVHDSATDRPLSVLPGWAASGHALLRDGWGAYVLITERELAHTVLRDPSGSVPVYHRREAGCDIYASDEESLFAIGEARPAADLAFIRRWLGYPYLRAMRTGCLGVQEIPPGSSHVVDANGPSIRFVWSPAACLARGAISDFGEAAARLREALLHCVPRMVPERGSAVLKLSGGLDSSLIAAALTAAGRSGVAVNFATRGPEGDERPYARAIAAACGLELVELSEDSGPAELTAGPRPRLRPPRHAMLRGLDGLYAATWRSLDADWVIDGAGGDNLFAHLNTAAPVLDAWACSGPRAVLAAIADLTRIHGGTYWTTAGFAWRKAARGTTTRWPANSDFLTAQSQVEEPECHPWLDLPADVLPGAREHIRSIVGVYSFLPDPSAGMPATVHPLLAQPILELCLRIPTHIWIMGGRDRAPARAALADYLPDAVRQRRHKGALGAMFRAQFKSLMPELRAFLLEGRLVDASIVDARAVARYLDDPQQWAGYNTTRLLEIAAAEQWLRSFG